ncbi:MAG: polymerase [Candidatus Peribacteria bacterium]|nr:polymerase [Candidatus Peribacteria bacterium]
MYIIKYNCRENQKNRRSILVLFPEVEHSTPMRQHLVLIDGHHLMYRAFFAIPRTMQTSGGELTNAVFGVASMLLTIIKMEQPDSLAFCFDAGEATFRHQENATYKDGRATTPDEFYTQIPRILELIDAFGFRHVADAQYEADDFLGAYACQAAEDGMRATIVSGDRDLFQMASEHIRIAIPHKAYQQAEYLGPQEILAKYGVRPDQIASYKGLTGDSSDNLPGVTGIGPKTASGLLQQYGTLQGIYDHIEDVKPTVREKLLRDKEQAFFCERMATLVCDLPLPLPLEELALQTIPVDAAHALFEELEFTMLSRRLDSLCKTPYGLAHFQVSDTEKKKVEAASQLSLF